MAVRGLERPPAPDMDQEFRDDVRIAVEFIVDVAELNSDRDFVAQQVEADYKALADCGRIGERYLWLPESLVSTPEMIERLDRTKGINGRVYADTYRDSPLWKSRVDANGYKPKDFKRQERTLQNGGGGIETHGRLAVFNTEDEDETLLHFLNIRFGEDPVRYGQMTQKKALSIAKVAYETDCPSFNLIPLAVKGVAYIARARRLKGGNPEPIPWGVMNDVNLTRKQVTGGFLVGNVGWHNRVMVLGASSGSASPDGGVGLSVGPKPQAS